MCRRPNNPDATPALWKCGIDEPSPPMFRENAPAEDFRQGYEAAIEDVFKVIDSDDSYYAGDTILKLKKHFGIAPDENQEDIDRASNEGM